MVTQAWWQAVLIRDWPDWRRMAPIGFPFTGERDHPDGFG
jgi:hypothetical protein